MPAAGRIAAWVAVAACVLTLIACAALAESPEERIARAAGFDALSRYAGDADFDAWEALRTLLKGEGQSPSRVFAAWADALRASLREALINTLRALLPPVALCAGLRLIFGKNAAGLGMADLLCALCCAVTLAAQAAAARETASAFLSALDGAASALTPVLVSALTLTGAPVTASILTPLAAECAALIDHVLGGLGLDLCAAACAVAVAGSLSRRFSLDRLFRLIAGGARWLLGITVFLFGGLMSVRGLMGAASDTAAARTAKLALENLVPVIGGELSGVSGSLAASAGMARRALGFTGALLIAHLCLEPMMKLAATLMSLRVAAALLEPLAGDAPVVVLIGRFADVQALVLALCACAALVTLLLAGGCAALL